ncbi:MAG: PDZ domain-containing protein [Rhodobacter sp.]|nr:PDZ domain-containing protein [Rhodobacter sp.]
MKLLSNIMLSVAVGAFGFTAGQFGLTLMAPPQAPFEPPRLAGSAKVVALETPQLAATWPAVFGVEVIPEPEPEQPEPEPVVEAEPEPEMRTDYILSGLVADGGRDSWAMVQSNGGFVKVVRVGDELEGGEVVTRIDAAGVHMMWGDIPQLIPVYREDLSHLAKVEVEEPYVPPETTSEVTIAVERLDRRFIERALVEAGRLVKTELEDGSSGLDVAWIQQGQLYDQFGLKTGDMILRVNGESVKDPDLLTNAPNALTSGGSLDLEIMRDGARQLIKVNLDQS